MRRTLTFLVSLVLAGGLARASQAPSGDYDLVVIGGGPAGNVSALKLAQSGKRVLVIEKRTADRARKQIVGIKGLSNGVLEHVDLGLGQARTARYAERPGAEPHAAPETSEQENPVKHMTEAFSTHTITIGDLESKLLAACAKHDHIDLQYKSELAHAPTQRDDGSLELSVRGPDGAIHTVHSQYMIVADGAGSSTLKLLDIPMHTDAHGMVAAAFFNQRGRNLLDYGEGVARVADADKTYTLTGLLPSQEALTGKALVDVVREGGKKVGIKHDARMLKSWTFPATMQYATKLTALENRVFVEGDAASTPHPLTGMGVNKAIYEAETTADTIGKLLGEKDEGARRQEIHQWRRAMNASRTALHAAALPIFQKYGHVDKVPKYLVLQQKMAAQAQARRAK